MCVLKLNICFIFLNLAFNLHCQIKIIDITSNNNIKTINDFPENNIKNEANIYKFHSVVFDKLIIESNHLLTNKLTYYYLTKGNDLKSLIDHHVKFYFKDSTAIVYDIDNSYLNIYKLIDTNLFEFEYEHSIKNERISNIYVYKSKIYMLTTQRKNNTIKLYSLTKNGKELIVEIEDPFYKIFISISEKSNYEFFNNLLIFRDYSNAYFKVFDLNKSNHEKFIYQFQNDTNLVQADKEIQNYRRYNDAKNFMSATERLSARNYLSSIYCLDSVIIVKTSSIGISNYNDHFSFIYKWRNNQFELIQQYNPMFPIEKKYLNQKMNFTNFCHLYSDYKTFIDHNSIIVCVKNLKKEDLENQFTLNEIYKKLNDSNDISPISFLIYQYQSSN